MNKRFKTIVLHGSLTIIFALTVYLLIFAYFNYIEDKQSNDVPDVTPIGQQDIDGRRVLYISSYSPSFRTFSDQVDGIRSQFYENDIQLEIEFMDTKRFFTEEHLANFQESLEYKLDNTAPYDAVITADDNATRFIFENKDTLFNNIPMVFLGVNDISYATEIGEKQVFYNYS